jgi:hypothetical protein
MILTPPFCLSGEEGKTLGLEGRLLSSLGITDAVLSLRSLDADRLQFSLRDNGNRPAIPDDGQWLTLRDDSGQVLFTGIAKRSFQYPARIYRYECANVYQGLLEAQLLGANNRPYITYFSDDLRNILTDILQRAADAGFPIAVPAELPLMYAIPKMAFRSSSFAAALEDALKWLPDCASSMDYSTTPPTLRFYCRSQSEQVTLDLGSDSHKTTAIDLSPIPHARAAGLRFNYAVRSGDASYSLVTQSAGDADAAGADQQSIFLSGGERMDAFLSESLKAALYAKAEVNKLIIAGGGTVTADTPSVDLSWDTCRTRDTNGGLPGAITAEAGFSMVPGTQSISFSSSDDVYQYDTGSNVIDGPYRNGKTLAVTPLYLTDATGTPLPTWYACIPAYFTDEQLIEVGATRVSGIIKGNLIKYNSTPVLSAGDTYLRDNFMSARRIMWNSSKLYVRYSVNCPVDALSMSPAAVMSLLAANNDGDNAQLFSRAGYASIPPDLAANYFARQDWTPYKGSLSLAPSVSNIPMPGDFLNVSGSHTPAEWATMAAPVAETEIDLRTGAPRITIGPSPRQDFRSLVDRLRIPAEDNYQAG